MTNGLTGKLAKVALIALLASSASGLAWADDGPDAIEAPVDPIPPELQNGGGSDGSNPELVDGGLWNNGNWVDAGETGASAPGQGELEEGVDVATGGVDPYPTELIEGGSYIQTEEGLVAVEDGNRRAAVAAGGTAARSGSDGPDACILPQTGQRVKACQ